MLFCLHFKGLKGSNRGKKKKKKKLKTQKEIFPDVRKFNFGWQIAGPVRNLPQEMSICFGYIVTINYLFERIVRYEEKPFLLLLLF